MTDEELSRVIHNLGSVFRPDSPYSRRLVLAGYRAAMEKAKEIVRCEMIGYAVDDAQLARIATRLEQQVKKEGA